MKKKLLYIICFFAITIILLVACKKEETPDSYVYYLNAEGTSIVKGEYDWDAKDPMDAADNILKGMRNPKDSVVHRSALPKDLKILSMDLEDVTLKIDFNEQFRSIKRQEEVLLCAAMVGSLSQIVGVQFVEFTIEGEPLRDGAGEVIGAVSEADFVRDIGEELNAYTEKNLHLYYTNSKGDSLVEEIVSVRCNNNIPIEKIIVEQLQKNPKTKGNRVAIPQSAKLLGVSLKDDVCYINFDDGLLQPIPDVTAEVTIYSIVNSIIDGGIANAVQISINGEKEIKFQDVVDLNTPLEKNDEIVQVEK